MALFNLAAVQIARFLLVSPLVPSAGPSGLCSRLLFKVIILLGIKCQEG